MVAGFVKPPAYAAAPGRRRLRVVVALGFAAMLSTLFIYLLTPAVTLDADARRAVAKMHEGLEEIKAMRQDLGVPLDPKLDPALSGLIGVDYSDITTTLGDLRAKQTSVNPQFAGLMVAWLKQAGVAAGDYVGVSLSGSFPALNLAALCACDALKLEALVISSVGASSYGANIPGFTWLDMEARLFAKELVYSHTRYASLGGIMDTGGGLDETGIKEGEGAIARHGAEYLREGTPRTVIFDVRRRMRLYAAKEMPKAFINVGGNVTSLGWVSEAALLGNGLLARIPNCSSPQRGTIFRMFENGVPVIHMINIERLAAACHLPIFPDSQNLEAATNMDLKSSRSRHVCWLTVLLSIWFVLGVFLMVKECAFLGR